jgi:capsular exopolysaccharide synthesis family protein
LSDVLCGEAKLEEVMIQDPVSNIYAIPAGSAVSNAADLLMSQRMRDLIAVLRTEFDYIVVDTPPLLPVIDALVLTSLVDRVLVIVEWSQTPRINISEASKILRPESHRIAGVILNKVDVSQLPAYGYRGAYYYGSAGNYARNR